MTAQLISAQGREFNLPALYSCVLTHTPNVPCSSFSLRCPYDKSLLPPLEGAAYCRFVHEGKQVFYGLVDDFELEQDGGGRIVSVSGRGPAALLIDNQAEAAEFGFVTLRDILERYVLPFGITDIISAELRPVSNLSVPGGSSLWDALYAFTQASGGITPRFSKDGTLVISPGGGARRSISAQSDIIELKYLKKRYGILSEVVVQRTDGFSLTVKNSEFIAAGGKRRRIITVPASMDEYAMRELGQRRIKASVSRKQIVSLTLPGLFVADGGDIVTLELPKAGLQGRYTVAEASTHYGDKSYTTLELVKE